MTRRKFIISAGCLSALAAFSPGNVIAKNTGKGLAANVSLWGRDKNTLEWEKIKEYERCDISETIEIDVEVPDRFDLVQPRVITYGYENFSIRLLLDTR